MDGSTDHLTTDAARAVAEPAGIVGPHRSGEANRHRFVCGSILSHRHTQRLRQLNRVPGASYETFRKSIEHPDPAICANVIIGLIKVTHHQLDQQIRPWNRPSSNVAACAKP